MKSHPNMTSTDSLSKTRKVWFTENCSNVIVIDVVPKGVNDLPSALMSWVPCSGRILSSLTCSLLITEQEAPESNNSCVCWLLILPEFYAGICCVVRALTTVGVHPQLAAPLFVSLLWTSAVACQMSPHPTLKTSDCHWYSSSHFTILSHMAILSTTKTSGWILTSSV